MTERLEQFLDHDLKDLWQDGERLLASASGGFHDYSFIIFPFAKVYEGFLKKLFFQIGAITEHQYHNDRWRVGKALNPELEKELRHVESVYDRLVDYCKGGTALADQLWEAWKDGRNRIFHYFPGQMKELSFEEAKEIIRKIERAMEAAIKGCAI